MKHLLFAALAAIITLSSCADRTTPSPEPQSIDSSAIVLRNIASRKSVRHFTSQPLSRRQLQTLARAAMAAPTACNKQPWAIIAIDRRSLLDSLSSALPYAKMLAQAPAAMIVCGDLSKTLEGDAAQFWIQDCSAATQNLLLAAESMGLGAVWTAAYPDPERINAVSSILNLPDNIIPLNVIPLGYPTGQDKPKDKWLDQNYHLNKW